MAGYDLNTVSGRLEWRLNDLGLTQAEFARAIKLANYQNITHWIKRNSIPKAKQFAVCKALNCRLEWLLAGERPIGPPRPIYLTPTQGGHPALDSMLAAYQANRLTGTNLRSLWGIAKSFMENQPKSKASGNRATSRHHRRH